MSDIACDFARYSNVSFMNIAEIFMNIAAIFMNIAAILSDIASTLFLFLWSDLAKKFYNIFTIFYDTYDITILAILR